MKKYINMKNILFTIATIFSFLFVSCADEKTTETKSNAAVLVEVNTPTIHGGTNFQASGTVKAKQNATLSTRMMGTVQNILVKTGEQVKKGQLLMQIDNKDVLAQVRQADAGKSQAASAFKLAKKNYERFKALLQKNSVSQKEFDDVETGYTMAKSQLEIANQAHKQATAQLKYSNIRAPFTGIITNRFVNSGDIASPGVPLMHLENTEKFEVITTVPEAYISKIDQNDQVKVIIKSNQTEFSGKVSEISRSAVKTGGQFTVRIAIETPNRMLFSGMYTSVIFPYEDDNTSSEAPTLVIPIQALIKKGQLTGIYTVGRNDVAQLRWLKIGKTFGDQVEVLSGLKVDEQFIISSSSKLYNGVTIEIQQ